jgi:hypothetical protein
VRMQRRGPGQSDRLVLKLGLHQWSAPLITLWSAAIE